jgi:phage-related baseplate assembly protein
MADLPVLPEFSFFDTDPQQLISDVKSVYEAELGREINSLAEESFIRTMAGWIALLQRQYDNSLKQNFLLYAEDEKLDQLGVYRKTPRLEESGSKVTLKFTLSSVQTFAIVIPAGTRATADNIVFFATDDTIVINAGSLSGTVTATSNQVGEASNNIPVGAINIRVDLIPYVDSVTNTDVSLGGRDRESNDDYRLRLYNAPSTYTTCGPREAYVYLAKQVSASIGEVTVSTDLAGNVYVYPLLDNGEVPNTALLNEINEALSGDTVRPLSDNVHVLAPNIVNYDINLTYYIYTADAGNVDQIQLKINEAIDNWILWQRSKIGRDINTSVLITRIVQAGAKRVDIALPKTTVVGPNGLAVNVSKTINFGGLEDE